MANFCGHCGASNEAGNFCVSCGRALDTAPAETTPADAAEPTAPSDQTVVRHPEQPAPTMQFPRTPPEEQPAPPQPSTWGPPPPAPAPAAPAAPPAPPVAPEHSWAPPPPAASPVAPQQSWAPSPPVAAGYPAAPGYPAQQQYPSAPAAPRVNPFHGWPIVDYVRDGAAILALLTCLGMPWDLNGDAGLFGGLEQFNHGGEHWWVVISALLAVISLAVPYAAKAGAVPGWSTQHYRLTKLGLNAPLALSVLVAVLFELIHLTDPFEGGLGSGIAMALTGIALAVQPRQSEDPHGADDTRWNAIARITTIAAVGLTLVLFVLWFLHGAVSDDVDIFDPFTGFIVIVVATLLMPIVMIGWPAFAMLTNGGSAAWRRVFVTSGFTVVVIALFSLASGHGGLFGWPEYEKWDGYFDGAAPGGGVLLIGAAAAFAVSAAQIRSTERLVEPVAGWLQTLRSVLLVAAAGSAVYAVAELFYMIAVGFTGGLVVAMILGLVLAAAAGFGTTLVADAHKFRIVLLGILGGLVVGGFVVMGIINGEDAAFAWVNSGWNVAAWISLPALGAWALVGPREVRTAFGPLVTSTPTPAGPPPGYPQQPQQPPPPGQYGGPPAYPAQQPPPPQPGTWNPPPQQPPPGWGPPPPQ